MRKNKNKNRSKDKKEKLDPEFVDHVKDLSRKGDRMKREGEQLGLGMPDEDEVDLEDALSDSVVGETQNPEEAHSLFYSIQEVLKSELPAGVENKKLRQHIYEEKAVYLTQGSKKDSDGIRGADSRQSHLHHLRVILKIVKEWVKHGAGSWDLYATLRKLNEELGYHDEELFEDREAEESVETLFGSALHYHEAVE